MLIFRVCLLTTRAMKASLRIIGTSQVEFWRRTCCVLGGTAAWDVWKSWNDGVLDSQAPIQGLKIEFSLIQVGSMTLELSYRMSVSSD